MPYVCLECYEIYNEKVQCTKEPNGLILCPKTSCRHLVVEVDELLLPTIVLLNQKGYGTKFCCSGHYYSTKPCHCYILFQENQEPPFFPEGYLKEIDNKGLNKNCCDINRYFEYETEKELIQNIYSNAFKLYEWASSLPERQNFIREDRRMK